MEPVAPLKGDVLIAHGVIDDTVPFRHTAPLIQALMAADKDCVWWRFLHPSTPPEARLSTAGACGANAPHRSQAAVTRVSAYRYS